MLSSDERKRIYKLDVPAGTYTANGTVVITQGIDLYVPEFKCELQFEVTDANSPTLISVGRLCRYNGFEYHWRNGFDNFIVFSTFRDIWTYACRTSILVFDIYVFSLLFIIYL